MLHSVHYVAAREISRFSASCPISSVVSFASWNNATCSVKYVAAPCGGGGSRPNNGRPAPHDDINGLAEHLGLGRRVGEIFGPTPIDAGGVGGVGDLVRLNISSFAEIAGAQMRDDKPGRGNSPAGRRSAQGGLARDEIEDAHNPAWCEATSSTRRNTKTISCSCAFWKSNRRRRRRSGSETSPGTGREMPRSPCSATAARHWRRASSVGLTMRKAGQASARRLRMPRFPQVQAVAEATCECQPSLDMSVPFPTPSRKGYPAGSGGGRRSHPRRVTNLSRRVGAAATCPPARCGRGRRNDVGIENAKSTDWRGDHPREEPFH